MLTIVSLIAAMLKGKTDIAPEVFVVTGLFDLFGLVIVSVTAYNLLELYLRCGQ